jgi:signal transduction histidine kinase/HAMP domain-containing protein
MRRGGLVLLLALPLAVLVGGRVAAWRVSALAGDAARADLAAKAAAATARFRELVGEAGSAAQRTLASGPAAARSGLSRELAERLEGAGVVRSGSYETWDGTPLEASWVPGGPGAGWAVVSRGVRTSLASRSETGPDGRHAIVSFTLEIAPGVPSAAPALPSRCEGATIRWTFPGSPGGASAAETFNPGPPARLSVPVLDPRDGVAAVVTVEQLPAAHVAMQERARSDALAALLFAALLAAATMRRPASLDGRRLLAIALAVVAARLALVWGRSFEELLPRSLGSPSLYGRGEGWGLIASPAALAATAAAGFLLARAFARWASSRAPLTAASTLSLAATALLGASLARDARVPVPRFDLSSAAGLTLALALGLSVAATAELLAALMRGRSRIAWSLAAIVPVTALALTALHRDTARVADERLRTAYAPLVLEQSARRRQALASAVSEAAASRQAALADAAFPLWVASDLFQQGFASSLDVVEADGDRVSHFGFGLPELSGQRESVPHPQGPDGRPVVVEESVSFGASIERVLHADAPVAAAPGARIVGHVLEDPANLPFLPGNAPYLRALGRAGSGTTEALTDEPDYVLYAGDGRVLLSTLHQPPAATPALRELGRRQETTELPAAGARYRALPLLDAGRLHLLLVPARGVLDVLGDGVRLLLIAGLLVLGASVLSALVAPGGGRRILDLVRASFYRKLLGAVIAASLVPLVGLAFLLRGAIARHGEAELTESAAAVVAAAQRVVADYQSTGDEDPGLPPLPLTDDVLVWLRRVVGQEIHLYEGGVLAATSKPEMFDSALRLPRLPGEIRSMIVEGGRPFVVRREALGAVILPVAYARADLKGGPADAILAIPLVLEQRTFARSLERLIELLLLGTTALAGLLAGSAALLARQVAGPVRRLADASRRIAGGDYTPRLASRSRDEMGSLVADFNSMAGALSEQRADLIRRRDYIEAVLRHATTGVVSVDADGRVVTINPAASSLLAEEGRAPSLGERLRDVLARSERFRPLAAALSATPEAAGAPIDVDVGEGQDRRRIRVVRAQLPDPAGGPLGAIVLLDDVTSLMRGNQLEAWAEMARSIAHEIKNPLTPIQLSAEHVRRLLADRGVLPSAEIDACLDAIVRQVRDLRDISQAFSTYARLPDLALEPADPASFLSEVVAPYRSSPPPGIEVREDHGEAPAVRIDRRILARAFVNLIANAVEAMPAGGTLTVGSRPSSDRSGVLLFVTDTGEGIDAAARARLFEPYFSTKSSGTGLGLAIVRRVVEAHGGTIEVATAPGSGTTFTVRLPAAS